MPFIEPRFSTVTTQSKNASGGTLYAGDYNAGLATPEAEGQVVVSDGSYPTLYVAVDIEGALEWKRVRIVPPPGASLTPNLPYWA